MPFASAHRPAIGVSLLKTRLREYGISTEIHYLNIKFAERIGLDLYHRIADTEFANQSLIGEFIFSRFAFDKTLNSESIKNMLPSILSTNSVHYINKLTSELTSLQELIPTFLEECVTEILHQKPELVGFTSTFHQNCASLSLARAIRQVSSAPIIFGGANCEGEMGLTLLKCNPWIDFVCSLWMGEVFKK